MISFKVTAMQRDELQMGGIYLVVEFYSEVSATNGDTPFYVFYYFINTRL